MVSYYQLLITQSTTSTESKFIVNSSECKLVFRILILITSRFFADFLLDLIVAYTSERGWHKALIRSSISVVYLRVIWAYIFIIFSLHFSCGNYLKVLVDTLRVRFSNCRLPIDLPEETPMQGPLGNTGGEDLPRSPDPVWDPWPSAPWTQWGHQRQPSHQTRVVLLFMVACDHENYHVSWNHANWS